MMTKFLAGLMLASTVLPSAPALAQSSTVGVQRTPDVAARKAAEGQVLELPLARMLRARTDLSWLVSPTDAERINVTPEQQAEARSIVALAQVSRSRGLDRHAVTKQAIRVLETAVLAEAARSDLLDGIKVGDADIAAVLKARPGRYDEYRLSHIFVAVGAGPDGTRRSDDEAKAIAARLKLRIDAGADFSSVAKSSSDDPSTAETGGDLSSMFGRYMADAFFPTVRTMSVGALSDPIHGKDGYHLVRLEEHIPATIASARFMVTQDIREERMPGLIADAVRASRR